MTDAWTDKKKRSIMNLCVNSRGGTCFLSSKDASMDSHTGLYIFEYVDRCIADVGAQNVVQVVTDNALNNVAAAKKLKEKRPNIFWTGCAAHTVDLMLEGISKLPKFAKTIDQARDLTVFIYAHHTLSMMRFHTKKRDIVRPGVTRFATTFLTLQSLLDKKTPLKTMFTTEEWDQCKYSKSVKGRNSFSTVMSPAFWNGVVFVMKVFVLLVKLLRLADGEKKPSMGFIFGELLEAKNKIKLAAGDLEKNYQPIFEIIDEKMKGRIDSPLHMSAYLLNPFYFYKDPSIEHDHMLIEGFFNCVETFYHGDYEKQDNVVNDEFNVYKTKSGAFGRELALRGCQKNDEKFDPELMVLGFISLLLTVLQGAISKICVNEHVLMHMLPCDKGLEAGHRENNTAKTGKLRKLSAFPIADIPRRLLDEQAAAQFGYCSRKHKVPLFPVEALHRLHIFIFVLAISHVTFCGLTAVIGSARFHQWKIWEDSITNEDLDHQQALKRKVTRAFQDDFVKEHSLRFRRDSVIHGWVHAFFKQFYGSVKKADYLTLRHGFIMTHCKLNPKFNFYQYMLRTLDDDFKRVVGINWYLWVFVGIFLLLNLNGWNTYFWIAFVPLILLLVVGTKMEHVMAELAQEVAEKHVAMEAELVVKPSDEHFWFKNPQIVLFLIHFILFQNAFEIAFFFWIWVSYGFESCMMGRLEFIIPRLVIGVFIQVFCSYKTLPLYAIATQMGSNFKKAIFEENVQASLVRWAQRVKTKRGLKPVDAAIYENSGEASSSRSQTSSGPRHDAMAEDHEIHPDTN